MTQKTKRVEAPIAVVPTRIERGELVALQAGLTATRMEIDNLRRYAQLLTVRPMDVLAVLAECDRQSKALAAMGLAKLFGGSMRDDIERVEKSVAEARKLAASDQLGLAWSMLVRGRRQIEAIGTVFDLRARLVQTGVPPEIRIDGKPDDRGYDRLHDSLDALIPLAGTANQALYMAGIRAAKLYLGNAAMYNLDNLAIRSERDALLTFLVRRGEMAKKGEGYTEKMAGEDKLFLDSIEQNVKKILPQVKRQNELALKGWIGNLDPLILDYAQKKDEMMRGSLSALKKDLSAMLEKVQKGEFLAQADILMLAKRYSQLTGQPAPMTEEERVRVLRDAALNLKRGVMFIQEGAPAWWGETALAFLDRGDKQRASLAVSMGALQRLALETKKDGARELLGSYDEISRMLRGGFTIPPGRMAAYSKDIEVAAMIAEADKMAKDFARQGTPEQRRLLSDAILRMHNLMDDGLSAGATTILNMVREYSRLLSKHGRKGWTGQADMEKAIGMETRGEGGKLMFDKALAGLAFEDEAVKFRSIAKRWGGALSAQKKMVEDTLKMAQALALEGNGRESAGVLMLLTNYCESVEKLGEKSRKGVIGLKPDAQRHISEMGKALSAMHKGERSVDGKDATAAFVASYNLAQGLIVEREVAALEARGKLTRYDYRGKETVLLSIRTIRERVEKREIKDAHTLLNYLKLFEGKSDLIRNSDVSGRVYGFWKGKAYLIGAIDAEIKAKTPAESFAAASVFDGGMSLVLKAETLQKGLMDWKARWAGTMPFDETDKKTVGHVPLGEPAS
ncbi:MAG: hypothetical protein V1827_03165, partial [Candidatus Micrarchaeota archaeon]